MAANPLPILKITRLGIAGCPAVRTPVVSARSLMALPAIGRLTTSPASLPSDTSALPSAYSRRELSDLELVLYLRLRDGDLPGRPPQHAPLGRCKYVRLYPNADCPWCCKHAA